MIIELRMNSYLSMCHALMALPGVKGLSEPCLVAMSAMRVIGCRNTNEPLA